MNIGSTRFWRDGLMIRSSDRKTMDQPLEIGIAKRWSMPGFRVYEDEAERGGSQVRLSAEFLWLWVNMLLCYTSKETRRWEDSGRSWGFYFMDRINLVLRWGKGYYSFDIPFLSLVFVKHEILTLDRSKVALLVGHGMKDMDTMSAAKKLNSTVIPYRYVCNSGEVQIVDARVCIERWTRRWKWTPFRSVEDSIWVDFSDEVGSRRGSWKGGMTGCGYTMIGDERVDQCLKRMEHERRFER